MANYDEDTVNESARQKRPEQHPPTLNRSRYSLHLGMNQAGTMALHGQEEGVEADAERESA